MRVARMMRARNCISEYIARHERIISAQYARFSLKHGSAGEPCGGKETCGLGQKAGDKKGWSAPGVTRPALARCLWRAPRASLPAPEFGTENSIGSSSTMQSRMITADFKGAKIMKMERGRNLQKDKAELTLRPKQKAKPPTGQSCRLRASATTGSSKVY